ncbi:heavy metal translocating P-type ATPase metal-binding domain-containing protein [Cerasicoccus frondis]|uniref:heavy metal translocating P-type ATPase metal-binding domain-containing protein n=1 Tax=Cerasicoccus frondis TaxID=490090 RepID=UPI002852B018|nr:heavy metal translocating P-type ATPase metal-binding domain-containing protein [Cerasicoccus frondis]
MATTSKTHCDHCGTPFSPKDSERFCCHGCAYVYQLLHDVGFTRFYDLKGGQATPPVGSRAFRNVDTTWLSEAITQVESEATGQCVEASFGVRGISCVGCVWLIEAIFAAQPGARTIHIDARRGAIRPRWDVGQFDAANFARELQKLGYEIVPEPDKSEKANVSRDVAYRIGICGFFLLNTMLFTLPGYLGMEPDYFLAPLFNLLGALFATLSLTFGGSYFFKRATQALRHKVLSIDFPIALGLGVAYLGSMLGWLAGAANLIYFDFVATFVFLMLVGRWLQEFALEKNRQHLNKRHAENQYVTIYGGAEDGARKPIENVKRGDAYMVAPGELNPVSSRLHTDASLSLEWINGEPEPVAWKAQQTAPAGAINVGLAAVAMTAEESWKDSLLARLLEAPQDNFHTKRLQRVLTIYIGLVLGIAVLGGLGWLIAGGGMINALQVFISVLIVSCPCALGVALPMTDELCQTKLRRDGLFVRNHSIWERLRQVRTIVFDKTGTLTLETPRLLNAYILDRLSANAALSLYQLVENNLHPVARSIRESLLLRYPSLQLQGASHAVKEVVGQGVYFCSDTGEHWSLGKPGWHPTNDQPETLQRKVSTVEFRCNGTIITAFEFEEDIRDDAREAIDWLKRKQYDIAILSGDAQDSVGRIAHLLGIDSPRARAQCTPDQKADWIGQYAPDSAMMIGDGANDRLAFDRAICRGAPIVDRSLLEASADFFFFGRSISCLPNLLRVAHQRKQAVSAIFALAIVYNVIAVSLCLAGAMHPLLAAILMPLSSIVTLLVPWRWLSS